ncbi:hypothetical protein [Bacillus phage PM1]|uniref:Uncharacterized protein n=1 Tax=Bacillus phage PM1 TaxID=547228 RepID=M4ZR22_9CAUD|nr:hypothetical protein K203_gp52 [Bacillus phage PM1]BAM99132.1 hypothetical protein [Bacillus phage PM1]
MDNMGDKENGKIMESRDGRICYFYSMGRVDGIDYHFVDCRQDEEVTGWAE